MNYSAQWINRQRAKGADILAPGKTPQEVYKYADSLRAHGYEPKTRVLKQDGPTPYPYYQWWRVSQPPATKWSARREGLVPMLTKEELK